MTRETNNVFEQSRAFEQECRSQQRMGSGPGAALLPCPFCGGAASEGCADTGAPYPGGYYYVACENVECPMDTVEVMKKAHATDEAAAVAWVRSCWNRRCSTTDSSSPTESA